jgi:hypothetical protein
MFSDNFRSNSLVRPEHGISCLVRMNLFYKTQMTECLYILSTHVDNRCHVAIPLFYSFRNILVSAPPSENICRFNMIIRNLDNCERLAFAKFQTKILQINRTIGVFMFQWQLPVKGYFRSTHGISSIVRMGPSFKMQKTECLYDVYT